VTFRVERSTTAATKIEEFDRAICRDGGGALTSAVTAGISEQTLDGYSSLTHAVAVADAGSGLANINVTVTNRAGVALTTSAIAEILAECVKSLGMRRIEVSFLSCLKYPNWRSRVAHELYDKLTAIQEFPDQSYLIAETLMTKLGLTAEQFDDQLKAEIAAGRIGIADDLPGSQRMWITRR